jgi:hypothetical protein
MRTSNYPFSFLNDTSSGPPGPPGNSFSNSAFSGNTMGKTYNLQEFDWKSINRKAFWLPLASRGRGKSCWLKRMLYEVQPRKYIAYAGTNGAKSKFEEYMLPCNIVDCLEGWSKEVEAYSRDVFRTQMRLKEIQTLAEKRLHYNLDIETYFIFDDMAIWPKLTRKADGFLSYLASAGRHPDVAVVFPTQQFAQILPIVREAPEYIVYFNCSDPNALQDYYKEFARGCGITFKEFKDMLHENTQNYDVVIQNRWKPTNTIADFYRVTSIPEEKLPRFVLGSEELKMQCNFLCQQKEQQLRNEMPPSSSILHVPPQQSKSAAPDAPQSLDLMNWVNEQYKMTLKEPQEVRNYFQMPATTDADPIDAVDEQQQHKYKDKDKDKYSSKRHRHHHRRHR